MSPQQKPTKLLGILTVGDIKWVIGISIGAIIFWVNASEAHRWIEDTGKPFVTDQNIRNAVSDERYKVIIEKLNEINKKLEKYNEVQK